MEPDKRALVVLATRVAEQLVHTALEGLLTEASIATVAIGNRHIKMTLTPPAEQKQLGPAAIERKKPGPKPGKRKYRKRKAIQRAPKGARPGAADSPASTGRPAASTSGTVDVASRVCRKCFKRGTAQRVAGSDRRLKCSACGFAWEMRVKRDEKGASPVVTRRIKAASEPGACRRCDHDKGAHVGDGGRCLIPRCVCGEFYQ